MKIKLNKKIIFNDNSVPLLIAEISANHNGNKKRFLNHIKLAHKNGADLIKIQTYEEQDITLPKYSKKFTFNSELWKDISLWELYKKAKTPYRWHYDAFKLAKKIGAVLFSTPFSLNAVDFLEKLNVPIYKIASFEITDYSLINKIAKTKKPIIISTGMATQREISNCLKIINKYHNKVIILHCVSGYPTPSKEANIKSILKLKEIFKKNMIGLSDHTDNIYSSIAASTMGIVAIEKHFCIDNKKTFDSAFSIKPNQLKTLKQIITEVPKTLGLKKIFLNKSEKKFLSKRRSIFSSQDIKKGEQFTEDNIISLRPKVGICATNYFKILGKKSKKYINKLSPIYKNYF